MALEVRFVENTPKIMEIFLKNTARQTGPILQIYLIILLRARELYFFRSVS